MSRDWRFHLLLACFVLSGLAGLIYQTAWSQQFALVFGASELAVATVLAAYMAGLAAGAAIAGHQLDRLRRPLLAYALLELGIAASALAVPAALGLATRVQVALLGGLDVPPEAGSLASALFYLVASFVILILPTGLMGATLPLLARHAVRRDLEVGPRVGLLYTANTVGAAVGTLTAAFVLLPRLGLMGTVWVAVGANLLVFGLAALLARSGGAQDPVPTPTSDDSSVEEPLSPSTVRSTVPSGTFWILPLILVSGIVSFTWEVLWTRLLSHLLGGSIYAFGTMLATFLVGIALGSAIASRWAVNRSSSAIGFAIAQIGIAMSSFAAFALVDRLPNLISDLAKSGGAFFASAPLAAATLLPGAVFIGATFPLAVRLVAVDAAAAGGASARVYAWNTVGAIVGAIATGFVLLPSLRIAGTATAAIATSLLLALIALGFARRRRPVLVGLALAGLVGLAIAPPETPWQVLRYSPLTGRQAAGEVVFYGVGRSATVLLTDVGEEWRLSTDGLPEAAIERPGARPGRFAMAQWLALLPQVSRPEMRSALIIGLGAGLTLEAVPPSVEEIHLVELEPEVVRANRSKSTVRRADPLADPRLHLSVNDARSALLLSDRRFDAILSQPSHPWTAGASHLFTRELFTLVRDRLEPHGVFAQWIGLKFVDADLLRVLVATLSDVFPYVELYQPFPGGGALFLSGLQPLTVAENAESVLSLEPKGWRNLGIFVPEDILVARLLDADGSRSFVEDGVTEAPLNTDIHNLLKTRAPRILRTPLGAEGARQLLAKFDPLMSYTADKRAVYLVRRLLHVNAGSRASRLAEAIQDPELRQVATAWMHLASGRPRLGKELLSNALQSPSAGAEAFHALLMLERRRLQQEKIPPPLAARLAEDRAAAAVVTGWRLVQAGRPGAIRQLEEKLAAVGPRHGMAEAASALRIAWRQASGDSTLAKEALRMLEPRLAHNVQGGSGLMQRTRLAAMVPDPDVALASLRELIKVLEHQPPESTARVERARDALQLLRQLPPVVSQDPRSTRLEADLSSLAGLAP